MSGQLDAARTILATYGTQLRTTREAAGMTLRDLADRTGISAPDLSRIETGRYCPNRYEAVRLETVLDMSFVIDGPGTDHARMSDPVSSDITVKSIAADKSLADKILAAAKSFGRPFDDTDLAEQIPEHDRNVIAKSRLCLMTELQDKTVWVYATEKVRVPSSESPLQQIPGVHERTRNGRTRSTIHFVYTGDTDTKAEQ